MKFFLLLFLVLSHWVNQVASTSLDSSLASIIQPEIQPSTSTIFRSSTRNLRIQGTGFPPLESGFKMTLVFEPELAEGVDFTVARTSTSELNLHLMRDRAWRPDAGPLSITEIQLLSDSGGRVAFPAGKGAGAGGVQVANVIADLSDATPNSNQQASARDLFTEKPNACTNSCATAGNGVCDDTRASGTKTCSLGSDCQDCGPVSASDFADISWMDDDGDEDDDDQSVDDNYWLIGFVAAAEVRKNPSDFADAFGFPLLPSDRRVYQSALSQSITINAVGLFPDLSLALDPPLQVNVDYTLTVTSFKSAVLTLLPGKQWRAEPGVLALNELYNAGTQHILRESVCIAIVLADPVINPDAGILQETQTRAGQLTGVGFANYSDHLKEAHRTLSVRSIGYFGSSTVARNTLLLRGAALLKLMFVLVLIWGLFRRRNFDTTAALDASTVPLADHCIV